MTRDSDDTPPHGIPRLPFSWEEPIWLSTRVAHGAECRKPIADCYVCSRTFDLIPKG